MTRAVVMPANQRLSEIAGKRTGRIAAKRLNSLRLSRNLLFDIASGGAPDPVYDKAKSFWTDVPWIEPIDSINALSAGLDYLEHGVQPGSVDTVHVLIQGIDDQLRFRLNASEAVRVLERPVRVKLSKLDISPAEMITIGRRKAPRGIGEHSTIMFHGCTTGNHDGLIFRMWFSFGCNTPILMPVAAIEYSLLRGDVLVNSQGNEDSQEFFRRYDMQSFINRR